MKIDVELFFSDSKSQKEKENIEFILRDKFYKALDNLRKDEEIENYVINVIRQ